MTDQTEFFPKQPLVHAASLDDPQLRDMLWQKVPGAGTGRPDAWVTIGSFDGVHKGHQAILRRLVRGAHDQGARAIVLTFHPHPSVVLRGRSGAIYLTSPEERAELLSAQGVDIVITQPFTRELAALRAAEFVQMLVDRVGMSRLLVGHDFALGRNREGDLPVLQRLGRELGYGVSVMRPILIEGEVVSSSRIRAALREGDVRQARKLLGYTYRVRGAIVPGDGRGRTIGIPTANLDVPGDRILPRVGVYACLVCAEGRVYRAVSNIGMRPTFTDGTVAPRLETHLMDYQGDLYGKTIQVSFVTRLRDEQRFSGVDTLVAQIGQDIHQAKRVLRITS